MRMGKKFPSKPTIATLLFISLMVYLFTSLILPSSDSRNLNSSFNSNPYPQVRIFLYDLPRKFTLGVVESYHAARDNKNSNQVSGRDKYPGHQHTAEWYLFSDLTNPTRPADSAVVRVFDPLEADLFFVPFFSSLSLVVNPVNGVAQQDGFVYSDEEMQDELVEFLEGSPYWKRNLGRDHVFVCQDPNALYKVIDQIKNGILIVSDFGRLRGDQGSYVKDVVVPYSHRINSFKGEIGVEGRRNLLFFMGNRYRKEGGKIRDTLFNLLEGEEDVVIKHGTQSRESRRAATQGMHSSKFCLHPAGDTPSACRLFDAIVSLCIPVVVSDYIELPFENVVDYTKIAIFVSTDAAVEPGYLLSALRGINTEKILEYQKELRKVKHYFEYEAPTGTVPEIWRQVSSKLSVVKFMINRDKRLVRSSSPSDFDCSCLCSNRTLLATSTL